MVCAATALAALQGIVEIDSIEGDVDQMGALVVDDDDEAILFLHGVGGELHELGEIPAANGEVFDGTFVQGSTVRDFGFVDDLGAFFDIDDGSGRGQPQSGIDGPGFSDDHFHAGDAGDAEARHRYLDNVGTDRQRRRGVSSFAIGDGLSREARAGRLYRQIGILDQVSGRIAD